MFQLGQQKVCCGPFKMFRGPQVPHLGFMLFARMSRETGCATQYQFGRLVKGFYKSLPLTTLAQAT